MNLEEQAEYESQLDWYIVQYYAYKPTTHIGVTRDRIRGTYRAAIWIERKLLYLGVYRTLDEAVVVYLVHALKRSQSTYLICKFYNSLTF